ncbi:MAG: hypothetical protein LBS53_05385 [Synergistaceae bacterium]|jgi:hypothetical protein|nr:hypothetical protein [Synergistaceae bacterium]
MKFFALFAVASALLFAGSAFAAESNVDVRNAGDFYEVLKNAGADAMTVINIKADIDAVTSATIGGTKEENVAKWIVIEGNGHTIRGSKGVTDTALRFVNNNPPTDPAHNRITLRNLVLKDLNSTSFRYGGGAIAIRNGVLEVENCAFIGNEWTPNTEMTRRGGGAIMLENSASSMKIINSTFYGNRTEAITSRDIATNAGAVGAVGSGGAIYAGGGGSVTNCTIVGNGASNADALGAVRGGGIYRFRGDAKLEISGNIIARNTVQNSSSAARFEDVYDNNSSGAGMIVDGGYNLISAAIATAGAAFVPAAGSENALSDWSFLDDAPKDNGGSTLTIALLNADNPAVDKIGDNAPKKDQRSFERVGPADIGAYEHGAR